MNANDETVAESSEAADSVATTERSSSAPDAGPAAAEAESAATSKGVPSMRPVASSTAPAASSADAAATATADVATGGATTGELQAAIDALTAAHDKLAEQLGATTAERDKLKDQLLRSSADFENFRRRSRTDIEEAKQRGKGDAIVDLLPVFDNLERAVGAAKSAKDITSVVEGVRMVLKLFDDTAERMGLSRVKTAGERFDPAVHDAIQQLEDAEKAPGTILSEVAAGYRYGKRLLRAAMVIVARPPAAPKPDAKAEAPVATDAATADAPASTTSTAPNDAEPQAGKPPEEAE